MAQGLRGGKGGAQREKDADEQRNHEDPGLRALHHLDEILRSCSRCERSSAGAAGDSRGRHTIWSSERLTTLRERVKKPLFQEIRSSLLSICRLLPSPSHSLHSTGEPPSSAARRQRVPAGATHESYSPSNWLPATVVYAGVEPSSCGASSAPR